MKLSEQLQAELNEQKARNEALRTEFDAFKNDAGAEKDALRGQIEATEAKIDAMEKIVAENAERERDAEQNPVSITKILAATVARSNGETYEEQWKGADHERQIVERAQEASDDSLGGYIVPVAYMGNEFIEALENELVVKQAGARVLSGLFGSPVELPKQTGGATGYWVPENDEITASTMTFGQVKLEPHAAAALVKISNRLLKNSTPAIDGLVSEDIAYRLAAMVDLAALEGTGVNGQPLGIKNTTGIGSVTSTATKREDVYNLRLEVAKDNALKNGSRAAWVTSEVEWDRLTRLTVAGTTSDMTPLVLGNISAGHPKMLLGYPVVTTNAIGNGTTEPLYFGNWRELLIGMWGNIEFLVSQHRFMEFNQHAIRAVMEVDTAVRHAESFALAALLAS